MATFPYRPDGRILSEFFWDRSPVSIIQGPVGSGSSSACCHKIWKLAQEQAPDPLERRRSRWIVVRNTYSQLEETTMKTWADWFVQKVGGQYGDIKLTHPPNHKIKRPLKDGTIVDLETIFYALDGPDDIANLLSLEPTGFWFNEMQFTMKEMFDAAHGRAAQGRCPAKIDGGLTWCGIIGDLNAPPEGHWIPYMRGDVPMPEDWDEDKRREYTKPEDWNFFVQPPGLIEVIENKRVVGYRENPAAENTNWLSQPYKALIKGKPKSYIDTFVMNRVGRYFDGKAVFETFREEDHVAKTHMDYNPDFPLLVGLDFARNPAAIIGQCIRGRVAILDEFGMENVSAGTFAPLLKQRLMRKFGPALTESGKIQFWGDPTGGSKGQGTDKTPFPDLCGQQDGGLTGAGQQHDLAAAGHR